MEMAIHIVRIVEIEGPIHLDEIATRIRMLWALGRAGARIRTAVAHGADVATRIGKIEGGPFFRIPGRPVVLRNRADVSSASVRKPEMLPPEEIEMALLKIVGDNFGAARDELVHAASRAFGFASTSIQLRAVLEGAIDRLVAMGRLSAKDGLLLPGH